MRELLDPLLKFLTHAPWYAAVVGALALIAQMMRSNRRRRRAAERRVRDALAATPAAPASWRDGDDVALRGVLDVERPVVSVAVLGFGGGRELCELGHASAEATLEVPGDDGPIRVALDGPLAVTVGSWVVRHHTLPTTHFEAATIGRDRARRAMQLDLWPSGIDAYHLRRIPPRDEVIARGRLRAVDGGWALVPPIATVEAAAIDLAAIKAVVDPVPAPPLGTLARAVLVGIGAWLVVALIARGL